MPSWPAWCVGPATSMVRGDSGSSRTSPSTVAVADVPPAKGVAPPVAVKVTSAVVPVRVSKLSPEITNSVGVLGNVSGTPGVRGV